MTEPDLAQIEQERKRAEETLRTAERNLAAVRKSERILREAEALGHTGSWEQDLITGEIFNTEENLRLFFGDDRSKGARLEDYVEVVHPDDRDRVTQRRAQLLSEGGPRDIEYRVVWPDGSVHVLFGLATVVRDETERPIRVYGTNVDITERKRAEEELRRREHLLRQVLDALPVGVLVVNLSGDIVLGNPASRRVWSGMIVSGAERRTKSKGWWHGTGKRIGPDEWASVRALTQGETVVNELIDIENFAGVRKVIKNSVVPIRDDAQAITGAVVINEDVTEVLQLENQLHQAQKMEAVGHLAGGVAHDFNNLLTIINGYSEVILDQIPAESPMRASVREIAQAGERAASLTRQLLAFSRKQVLEPKVLDLNAVVTDTAKMLRRLLGEDIDLKTVLEPGLGRVKADPGQIEQVLMNLAVNARDAMPRGGNLTIETANADLDETYTRYSDLRPGSYVLLAVSDTGIGMDEATRARIFEPFFTTKGPGQGTGLGLATVYGIVKQSNGQVDVASEPGQGTTFKIHLPVVEEVIAPGKSQPARNAPLRGNETILLAEDEPALRALTRHILQLRGYTGTIHLLVTDVVMPVMSGRQLAERLAAIRPGVKVLYLSGYADDAVIRHGILQAETAFLQKPFTPSSLAAKVREVLDQQEEEGSEPNA
jgi:two-component system cell cycle sensor histidine kinase/response regulator CckA